MGLVEPLEIDLDDLGLDVRSAIVEKLNELIVAHNSLADVYEDHVHYSREIQFPTAGPDDNNP